MVERIGYDEEIVKIARKVVSPIRVVLSAPTHQSLQHKRSLLETGEPQKESDLFRNTIQSEMA